MRQAGIPDREGRSNRGGRRGGGGDGTGESSVRRDKGGRGASRRWHGRRQLLWLLLWRLRRLRWWRARRGAAARATAASAMAGARGHSGSGRGGWPPDLGGWWIGSLAAVAVAVAVVAVVVMMMVMVMAAVAARTAVGSIIPVGPVWAGALTIVVGRWRVHVARPARGRRWRWRRVATLVVIVPIVIWIAATGPAVVSAVAARGGRRGIVAPVAGRWWGVTIAVVPAITAVATSAITAAHWRPVIIPILCEGNRVRVERVGAA